MHHRVSKKPHYILHLKLMDGKRLPRNRGSGIRYITPKLSENQESWVSYIITPVVKNDSLNNAFGQNSMHCTTAYGLPQ